MREIDAKLITETVAALAVEANCFLPSDIESRIGCLKVSSQYMIFVVALTLFAAILNLVSAFNPANSIFILNLIVGICMSCLSIASTVATVKLFLKLSALKKERAIHE